MPVQGHVLKFNLYIFLSFKFFVRTYHPFPIYGFCPVQIFLYSKAFESNTTSNMVFVSLRFFCIQKHLKVTQPLVG